VIGAGQLQPDRPLGMQFLRGHRLRREPENRQVGLGRARLNTAQQIGYVALFRQLPATPLKLKLQIRELGTELR
jgi:hypothetical protein